MRLKELSLKKVVLYMSLDILNEEGKR